MKDSREKLIRKSLIDAKNKGIKIWPGATFDWTNRPSHLKFEKFEPPGPSGNLPSACSAIGALELALGKLEKIIFIILKKYVQVSKFGLDLRNEFVK